MEAHHEAGTPSGTAGQAEVDMLVSAVEMDVVTLASWLVAQL